MNVLIVPKLNATNDPEIISAVAFVKQRLEVRGHDVTVSISDLIYPNKDLVISIGGDGTSIQAAKFARECDCRLVSIHMGHLGFLADFALEDFTFDVIDSIADDYYSNKLPHTEQISLIAAFNGETDVCSNEFTISGSLSDSIVEIDLYINGAFAGNHICNGINIATPTGSTAYSLSLGGPIVDPTCQVMIITFIAPFTLTARPIVVNAKSSVQVVLRKVRYKGLAQLKADGQLLHNDVVSVTIGKGTDYTVCHREDWTFYDTLTKKLSWNK